jgi:hypothetical protein
MSEPDPRALADAEAFARLLADPCVTRARLVEARASAEVWRDVLDRYPFAAAWVAANTALPAEIADLLVQHPEPPVRAALASAASLPEAVMLQLAHDKNELIRLRVVCNAQATREVLTALTADPCQLVSAHAQARLVHDISGVALPASYLDDVPVLDLLH